MLTRVCALILLSVLAACGPRAVTSEVTRFHAAGFQPVGESFTILPQGEQVGSLEFQAYAEEVAQDLRLAGLRAVPPGNAADYVVLLNYGVGEAVTQTYSRPIYGSAGYYSWGSPWYGLGATLPLGRDVYSTSYYPKYLGVVMLDGDAYQAGQRISVWEGRAVAETRNPGLAPAVPYLSEALFSQFPGPSGATVRVDVPVNQLAQE